jgi:DNA-binding XRE family transcriptional regulator
MAVRFEKTSKGEVAILPRAEYEALLDKAAEAEEDAGTARIVDRAKAELAAGAPRLPKSVVDRLVAGENPVRVIREWRGYTQMHLAEMKLNIGQGHLSDIETGRRKGTAATLRAIADALEVPLDLLA